MQVLGLQHRTSAELCPDIQLAHCKVKRFMHISIHALRLFLKVLPWKREEVVCLVAKNCEVRIA